jgi:hypothetical protein
MTTVGPFGKFCMYITLNITKGRMNVLLALQRATTVTFSPSLALGKLVRTVTPSVEQFSEEYF